MNLAMLSNLRVSNFRTAPNAIAPEDSCDAVDLAVLASYDAVQLDGEPDLVVELIDLYVDDARCRLAAMHESVTEKDWPAVKREIHSLKGSSGNLGARQVAWVCEEIEKMEPRTVWISIPALLTWLQLELDRAIHILVAVRQTRITN